MRVSRIQAEENRQTVINVASRLFREHGFDGIGLKDLMKGAGLTQGAFYKQFASKEDLAAQASRRALESAADRCSAQAETVGDESFRDPRSGRKLPADDDESERLIGASDVVQLVVSVGSAVTAGAAFNRYAGGARCSGCHGREGYRR